MVMGTNDGFETVSSDISIQRNLPQQIETADFNNDGFLDLALLSTETYATSTPLYEHSLFIMPGKGDGSFTTPFVKVFTNTTDRNSHFCIGDFTDDGWADIALLEPGRNHIKLAVNDQNGDIPSLSVQESSLSAPEGSVYCRVGDFDGNGTGDLALAVSGDGSGRIDVLLSAGDGTFTAAGSADLGSSSPVCIAVGLINKDDVPDVAAGAYKDPLAEVCVVFGDGSGGLSDPVAAEFTGSPSDIAIGDLDGNGFTDVAVSQSGTEDLIYTFLLKEKPGRSEFVRSDANGDGALDLSDVVTMLVYLFSGEEIDCRESLDSNDDFNVDISDAVYLLGYLFAGGQPPQAPFPEAGVDPEPETLGCDR